MGPIEMDESQVIEAIKQANRFKTFTLKDIKYKYSDEGLKTEMIIKVQGEIGGVKNSMLYNLFS